MRTEIVKCNACRGRGFFNYSDIGNTHCKGCHGQGTVVVVSPATKCGACGGRGFFNYSDIGNSVCRGCGGSGWAHRV